MSDRSSKLITRKSSAAVLPPIPDKVYFTIGEVGSLCRLKPHVLRYWEQEFSQLAPTKRRGNRRYYQHKDVLLVRRIRRLLYDDGYTIEGARQQLQLPSPSPQSANRQQTSIRSTQSLIQQLQSIARHLRDS